MSNRSLRVVPVLILLVIAYGCTSSNVSPTAPTLDTSSATGVAVGGAKLPKLDICHITGNGKYVMINVSGNAKPAHMAHGDSLPGEDGLDENCVPITVFVTFIDISTSFFGEGIIVDWTVEGTEETVTYYVEGFDGVSWGPIVTFPPDGAVVVGTGNGTYSSGVDTYFFDLYRVRAVDGGGNEVISPEVDPFA